MDHESRSRRSLAVLGAGESGVGAALLARLHGLEVFVSDRGPVKEAYKQELEQHGIPYEEGRHSEDRLLAADEVVKSPGIPDKAPIVQTLLAAGKPVISEIEFAARYTRATLVGITGSNGKTTTTRLTYHLLHAGGKDVAMAGNVGNSFARLLTEAPRAIYVLELSSFQLDGIDRFRPQVAMLLNITPDHLDRYDYELGNYVQSKFRIIRNQRAGDLFLFNEEDDNIRDFLTGRSLTPRPVALGSRFIHDGAIRLEGATFDLSRSALRGRHNAMNALFAIYAARYLGVGEADIRRGLETFVNAPHRLEFVADLEGVTYYNDSKATNVDSVFYALEAMNRPTVWIVGGQDKGNDYGPLLELVRRKVKAIVCMGLDNEKIKAAFGGIVARMEETRSAGEAVAAAARLASGGDVVLLSPACASFDLFRNYEDRGEQFKAEVLRLVAGRSK